eukprot:1437344-Rhodomonas_salina.3
MSRRLRRASAWEGEWSRVSGSEQVEYGSGAVEADGCCPLQAPPYEPPNDDEEDDALFLG